MVTGLRFQPANPRLETKTLPMPTAKTVSSLLALTAGLMAPSAWLHAQAPAAAAPADATRARATAGAPRGGATSLAPVAPQAPEEPTSRVFIHPARLRA
jgi:zona occludens toxin (predicted ATPase)